MPGPFRQYRGRFAPSPTGPLHLGSLIAALASYLDARSQGGAWLVRMENLDPPREESGAAEQILASLRQHGLHWDGPVLWQGDRLGAYRDALARLDSAGELFLCDCTRARLGPGGACAGRCLPRQDEIAPPCATRITVRADTRIEFIDGLQGSRSEPLGHSLPDFILLRKDGLFAYQLAVVVDDAFQGITHVVRGSDLLESTARQIYLQQRLGSHTPAYCHLPVITNSEGQKFSKQNHAPALQADCAADNLRRALAFLHQPPPTPGCDDPEAILAFAVAHWSPAAIPHREAVPASAFGWSD